MKKFGIALISLGIYCAIFAFNIDVVIGTTYNIGLLNERQNIIYLSGVIFLAGIILFGFGFSSKEESKNFKLFAISVFLLPALIIIFFKIEKFIKDEQAKNLRIEIERLNKEKEEKIREEKENEIKKQKEKILQDNLMLFIDNKDGTVTHKKTGLTWQRCSVGQKWNGKICEGMAKKFSWEDADKLFNSNKKSLWRIPSEFESINLLYCSDNKFSYTENLWDVKHHQIFDNVDGCANPNDVISPAVNPILFPNTEKGWYWAVSETGHPSVTQHNFDGSFNDSLDEFDPAFIRLVH